MKIIRKIIVLALFMGLLLTAASCVVFDKKDNRKHKGWQKDLKKSTNPHHLNYPNNTNLGKSKGVGKKK